MLKKIADRLYDEAADRLPRAGARIDLLRPSFRETWGGPLNGQKFRREIVRSIARATDYDRVIETGTFRGSSTEFFSAVFGTPIATAEASPRFYRYSLNRLGHHDDVAVTFGDSRSFLRALARDTASDTENVFVYLDAHWEKDLPLAEELEIIDRSWPHAIVMVDDFQVPDDDGYRYDDYGPGMALRLDYLPSMPGWGAYFPDCPSHRETGARRGSVVLAAPAMADVVKSVDELVAYPGWPSRPGSD